MKGYVTNIEQDALANNYFRKVLYTDSRVQLVLMSLLPGEEIGAEVHQLDQFIRIEHGTGVAVLESAEHALEDGSVVVIPQGTLHNIINRGTDSMKLYTLYSPPNHKDGKVHKTKAEAEADESSGGDVFDGQTTEAA